MVTIISEIMVRQCQLLIYHLVIFVYLYTLAVTDQAQSLALPLSLVNPNITSGCYSAKRSHHPNVANTIVSSNLPEGWPDGPFAVPLDTISPDDHCYLSFPKVGDKQGGDLERHFFLIQVLEEMVSIKAQPAGSTPRPFDIDKYDVRIKMEIVPQLPMTLDMAHVALEIIYEIVMKSEVREFTALVVCQGLAMGRFRTWLSDQ